MRVDTGLLRAIAASIEWSVENAETVVNLEREFNGDAWVNETRRNVYRGVEIGRKKEKLKKAWPELYDLLTRLRVAE